MKNIFKIYSRDLKKIFTNSMAIILAVGLAILPSLYAWFNIYANWDPYGSTGNMMVAVINEDKGFNYQDIKINIGEEIVSNLKSNDAIDWQFVSEDEAISGIKAGKYYAGISIPKDFSKSFASIMTPVFVQPKITYYANEKKNAIATKITDKVIQTVQTEVNESFVTTVIDLVNAMLGVVVEKSDIEAGNAITSLQEQISIAQDGLKSTQKTLDSFNEVLSLSTDLADSFDDKNLKDTLNNTITLLDGAENLVNVSTEAVGSLVDNVGLGLTNASQSVSNIADSIRNIDTSSIESKKKDLQSISERLTTTKEAIDKASSIIKKINDSLPIPLSKATEVTSKLDSVSVKLGAVISDVDALVSSNIEIPTEKIANSLEQLSKDIVGATSIYKSVQPSLEKSALDLLAEINSLSNIMDSLSENAPKVGTLAEALNKSAKVSNSMIESLATLVNSATKQLKSLSDKLESLKDSEILNTMTNLTKGNADELGAFIACPVKIETDKIYGIENYGSAMAPFYSTLAIWVGGMFLVAVLSTNVKKKKEIGIVKMHEAYFGRGLTFLTLSFIQGMIICLGDLLLFRIQCFHPIKFMIAGGFASLVFTFFIYSLTYALGDLGKTVGVIMLVLQIGGSGGTFPIDVCPPLFRAIHPYLPFTFVIEAMRECICGLYENEFWMWLLKLCAYILVSLFIGLGVKLLVHKPLKFFEYRLEETDLV